MSNLDLQYRPVRIGVSIINGRVNEPGTIGLFGKDQSGQIWLVSCYHVLCDGGLGPYVADEPIFQPAAAAPQFRVAQTDRTRSHQTLDCAAARIDNGIAVDNAIAGLGSPMIGTTAPTTGMRLMKVGAVSNLSEGIVTQVQGNSVMIRSDPQYSPQYVISQPGDSGCLWLEQGTGKAVALHRGIRNPRTASAIAIDAILDALDLNLL